MMMLDLLRNCTLIQNKINSVAQFCKAMIQILENLISIMCQMFLNDIAVKEPQISYNDEKVLSKVCCYILKFIQNLNKVLVNMKCAERCVFSEKSQFIMKRLKIVDFICKLNECFSKTVKVLKIVK